MSSTNISKTISDTLSQLENARRNLASIDLTLVNEIQSLLQAKASLQTDIAYLRMEKKELSKEVAKLKKEVVVVSEEEEEPDELDGSGKDKPPEHFLCPLTLEVMKVPMQHKETKHNYERKAIFEWIYFGKATCPLTRKVLHPEEFVENVRLRKEIEFWKAKNGMDDDDSEDELDQSDVIPNLSPEEEKEQQARLAEAQVKRNGSHKELMGIRSRVLEQRDTRVRRRLSQGYL